jgi:preprotein translocase subunit SecE
MINYLKESYNELRNHVTWTPWGEAQRLTVIVAAFSVVLALVVWGVDSVFSKVITFYFDLIKS